MITDTSNLNC